MDGEEGFVRNEPSSYLPNAIKPNNVYRCLLTTRKGSGIENWHVVGYIQDRIGAFVSNKTVVRRDKISRQQNTARKLIKKTTRFYRAVRVQRG